MQGMLSQFKGLIVDWRRGSVSPPGGHPQPLSLHDGFWRDLSWWRTHLERRSLSSLGSSPRAASAVLAGTDASGWGTGQVLWLGGAREEVAEERKAERVPVRW